MPTKREIVILVIAITAICCVVVIIIGVGATLLPSTKEPPHVAAVGTEIPEKDRINTEVAIAIEKTNSSQLNVAETIPSPGTPTLTLPPTDTPTEPLPTPTSGPTQTPVPVYLDGTVGSTVESHGFSLTVLNVSKTNKINDYTEAKEGNIFLVLEVIIENISNDSEVPYNPLYFKVRDKDGYEYDVSYSAPDPNLKSGNLLKGEKTRGFVAFEIKNNSSGLVAIYRIVQILSPFQTIRIDLGQ